MVKCRTLFLVVGLASLIVYMRTLPPTITWHNDGADSGDFATAVAVGGVPHPPGYPTYLVLGEVFKRLPLGDIAYRLNLMSATSAAGAAALAGLIIYRTLVAVTAHQAGSSDERNRSQTLMWICAGSASLALAFSSVFWSQAVIAEVHSLNVLFAAILLCGALQVRPTNQRWLIPGLAALFGLSLGNHPIILLWLPLLLWNLKAYWRWPLLMVAFLAFCLGLSVYSIIPIRAAADPPVNWGLARTWPNFLWLVSAEPYRHFVFGVPWEFVPVRILSELRLLAVAFMGWGLAVGLLGLLGLVRANRPLGYSSLSTFFLFSAFAIGYDTTDSYMYLLPALLIFSLWIGWGLYEVGTRARHLSRTRLKKSAAVAWGLILLLPWLSLGWNWPQQNLSEDVEAYEYARRTLQSAAPEAVIIAETDHQTFALWYARYGLGLRPDVAIVSSNLLPYAWYRQTLQETHGYLLLSDQAGRPVTTLPAFVEMNVSSSPIYLVPFHATGLDSLGLPVAEKNEIH